MDQLHPKQKLLFYVTQDISDNLRSRVHRFVAGLAELRVWSIAAPTFVNFLDEAPSREKGDMDVETLGGFLEIYSSWPPHEVPHLIDKQQYEDVVALVGALRAFSKFHELEFEVELEQDYVGSISNGDMDESLAEGLLGEWRRKLDASNAVASIQDRSREVCDEAPWEKIGFASRGEFERFVVWMEDQVVLGNAEELRGDLQDFRYFRHKASGEIWSLYLPNDRSLGGFSQMVPNHIGWKDDWRM